MASGYTFYITEYKDIKIMGLFDYDRAKAARDKKADYNINELMSQNHFTKYDEFKVSDHRNSYELKRIADSLERIEKYLQNG